MIEPGWNMFYDLDEPSPILKRLEINGRLTFKPGSNRLLRANIIHIRAGELIIGTETQPFTH